MSITIAGLDAALGILDTVYLDAHSGAPGADGSTNAIGGTRPAITMGAAATDGGTGRQRANTAAVTFTGPGAGTYQAWSLWDAATAGTCRWIVPFDTNRTLLAGDDLRAPIGGVTASIAPAV